MGQKVNPNGLRYGINKNWESRWIANSDKQTAKWIVEDEKIRKYFFQNRKAQVVRVEIERSSKSNKMKKIEGSILILVYACQIGLLTGKNEENLPAITLAIQKIVGRRINVQIKFIVYENVGWSARVIAREIADDIENRVPFRLAQKNAIKKVMSCNAKGIKTNVSGRLGGVEMAREEGYTDGIIPLTTLRTDIDYALEEAQTTYGKIGVKVWINRGEILDKGLNNQNIPKKEDVKIRQRRSFKKDVVEQEQPISLESHKISEVGE